MAWPPEAIVTLAELDASFEKNFRLLIEYKEKHGDCLVPQSHALGKWVNYMRTRKKQGKLGEELVERLNEIDSVWSVK